MLSPSPARSANPAEKRESSEAVDPRVLDSVRLSDSGTVRPDWAAVQAGAVLFGVAYAAALAVSVNHEFRDDTGWLAIPVVGPWANLWGGSDVAGWALAADGITQLAGGSLFVVGFSNPRTVLGPATAEERKTLAPAVLPQGELPRTLTLRGHF
jgi:hypothetical protein